MDINTLRIGITLVSLAAFVGIVFWSYRPSRVREMERQARIVLEDDEAGRRS